MVSTPAFFSSGTVFFPIPTISLMSRGQSLAGTSDLRSTVMPMGLRMSLAIFARKRLGATPMEHFSPSSS